MKLILTGATGFSGTEILHQCLQNPQITSLIVLSRRSLPSSTIDNPKLDVVILDDFNKYPESVLAKIPNADGCLWSMGAKSDDVDIAQTVDVDYTIAFLNAIEKTCLAMARKTKFRFVYLSGLLAERDPDKSLWFLPIRRRSKGKTELSLLTFQSLHPSLFQAIILRPGRFLAKEGGFEASIMGPILGDKRSIRVDVLAAAMIDLAVKGDRDADGKEVFVNEDIVRKGRGVLEEGLKGGR